METLSALPYDDADFKALLAELQTAVDAFDYDRVVSIAMPDVSVVYCISIQ